ncbi:MAG: hypothetical protein ACREEM_08255 [Blastocatellia bacterium]
MIRTNRLFVNWLLVLALLAQALSVVAQDKRVGKIVNPNPAPGAEAILKVAPPACLNGVVTVNWQAGAPEGVTTRGFDVTLDVGFSNGQSQRLNRSAGGNERSATFNIKIPEPPKGGNSGGGKGGTGGGDNGDNRQRLCERQCLRGGGKERAFVDQQCLNNCLNGGKGDDGGGRGEDKNTRETGGGKDSGGKGSGARAILVPLTPADPITITALTATVTGKFSFTKTDTASSNALVGRPPLRE